MEKGDFGGWIFGVRRGGVKLQRLGKAGKKKV
jgi:hypothetical protein